LSRALDLTEIRRIISEKAAKEKETRSLPQKVKPPFAPLAALSFLSAVRNRQTTVTIDKKKYQLKYLKNPFHHGISRLPDDEYVAFSAPNGVVGLMAIDTIEDRLLGDNGLGLKVRNIGE
jgi:hypothetical protein